MQFTGKTRRKNKITKLEGTEDAGKYVHGLQMYKVPPTDNITLEEFEEFAIDRLKGKLTNQSQQELLRFQSYFQGMLNAFGVIYLLDEDSVEKH